MDLTHLNQALDDAKKEAARGTVLLWGPEDLLRNAVEALLVSQWNVIRIGDEQGLESMDRNVRLLKPDLLVVNWGNLAGNVQALLALVQSCPALKIIAVNPENNLIEVYDKHLHHLKSISDLLSIVNEPSHSSLKGGE